MSAAGSTSFNAFHTKSLDACFKNSACQKAEIMWALKRVYNGLNDSSAKMLLISSKLCFQIVVRLQRKYR